MNKLLSPTTRALPAAVVFAAAAVLSTGAHADEASKKALAVKLAQLQQKSTGAALATQLANGAVQERIASWAPQLQERVPADKQKEVNDKLNAELQKFGENTHRAAMIQADKTARDALVPVFMNKLSESELKIIVTYLQTPASAKFADLGGEAAQTWVKKIVDGTQTKVQEYIQAFDAAAEKIVNAAAGSSAPAPAAPASTPPASDAPPASGAPPSASDAPSAPDAPSDPADAESDNSDD